VAGGDCDEEPYSSDTESERTNTTVSSASATLPEELFQSNTTGMLRQSDKEVILRLDLNQNTVSVV